jgi:oligoendopeptidase F
MKKSSNKIQVKKSEMKKIKIKDTWDFSVLYKGINDPAIDTDTAEIENLYLNFAKKYENDDSYIADTSRLLIAIQDYTKLIADVGGIKPFFYLNHYKDIDTSNAKASAKATQISERLTKAGNHILFFEIKLTKIPKENQQEILNDVRFAEYRYFLKKIFGRAKYNLTEAEEKILALKGDVSHKMWVDAQKKLATSHTVKFKGKDLLLSQAFIMRKDLPQKDRYALHDILALKFKEISFMAEAELNAVVNNKKIEDELRGAKTPYELTVVNYENDIKTVENLIKTVTENRKIAHSFYAAKAKIMGLKKLRMPDLNVNLSKKKKKISFEESLETVHSAFAKVDPFFADFLLKMIEEGRVDIYPRKGKRGGAYCTSTSKKLPIYILLNFDHSLDGTMTLAHEMGHAIHTELSFEQPDFYTDYTISVAEVASTFFEHIVFDHIFETLSEEEKVIALFNDIEDNIGLIFRQTQFFNFEKDLHDAIRSKGSISKEEMASLYVKNAKLMNGPVVDIRETDGYYFTNVPHFRYFFYVYSYAYGQIISKALYAKYKKDPSFIEKVKDFMRAGGSMSPSDIFKSIGIDTTDPEFFKEGIMQVKTDLEKAVKLAKKIGLMK